MATLETILGDRLNVSLLRWLSASQAGLTGNGIAQRLGAHQSSVRKALERLVVTGVVTRRDVGRAASYALDEKLAVVRQIILPLFAKEQELWREMERQLRAVAARAVPPARAIILFGSVARRERGSRDIDLLVISPARSANETVRDRIVAGTSRLARRYGLPIGLTVLAASQLDAPAIRSLLSEVKRDGVLLAGSLPRSLTGMAAAARAAGSRQSRVRARAVRRRPSRSTGS
jgi:predicted nucleotidyltransferase